MVGLLVDFTIVLENPMIMSVNTRKTATPVNICAAIYSNGFASADSLSTLKCAASINYHNGVRNDNNPNEILLTEYLRL